MVGEYVSSIREPAQQIATNLGRVSGRYREVGSTLTSWGPELTGFQNETDRLWRDADTAQYQIETNQPLPVQPTDSVVAAEADAQDARARERRRLDAIADLAQAQRRLSDVRRRRDDRARAVAAAIRDHIDDAITDSWWDNVKDFFDDHADTIKEITTVLGYIGMACLVISLAIPGLNIISAIALGAGIASLAGNSALALTGNGSWIDVGLDTLALATFGVGKIIGPGSKLGANVFGKLFGEAGAALWTGKAKTLANQITDRGTIHAARNSIKHATRTHPTIKKSTLRRQLRDTYRNETTTTASQKPTPIELLTLGGTDKDLTTLTKTVTKIRTDFPNKQAIQNLAQEYDKNARIAKASFATSAVITLLPGITEVTTEASSVSTQFKERFIREVGSSW